MESNCPKCGESRGPIMAGTYNYECRPCLTGWELDYRGLGVEDVYDLNPDPVSRSLGTFTL